MKILLATQNINKVREHKKIFMEINSEIMVHGLQDIGIDVDIEETSSTLLGNARLKAKGIYNLVSDKGYDLIVSEDFGFFIESFPDIAGVHAKRWKTGTNKERSNAIIELFKKSGCDNREAKYVTVLVAIDSSGKNYNFRGELKGEIGDRIVKDAGFAYDQIFKINDGRYISELTEDEKNSISSRRRAVEKLAQKFNLSRPEIIKD